MRSYRARLVEGCTKRNYDRCVDDMLCLSRKGKAKSRRKHFFICIHPHHVTQGGRPQLGILRRCFHRVCIKYTFDTLSISCCSQLRQTNTAVDLCMWEADRWHHSQRMSHLRWPGGGPADITQAAGPRWASRAVLACTSRQIDASWLW